jgi:hypothetical protein
VNNKTATATASLVAAVPAAVLGYFLVNTFLTKLDQLKSVFLGLYGVTLAACAAIVFLPFAILIFGPKSPRAGAVPKKSKKDEDESTSGKSAPISEDALETAKPELDEEVVEEADDAPISTSTGELEVVEPTPSEDEFAAFDAPFDEEEVESEAIESDEFRFDDEEPPPPKKKKK